MQLFVLFRLHRPSPLPKQFLRPGRLSKAVLLPIMIFRFSAALTPHRLQVTRMNPRALDPER